MPPEPLHELQTLVPDHPTVRAVLWHLDGLRQKGMTAELWLTERERAEGSAFGHERRRREWQAARIALKRLLVQDGVVRSPLHAEIRKNELGQPRIVVYVPETGHYEEIACSLAHKNRLVVAAYARRKVRVGVDIECRSWRLPHLCRRFECPADRMLPLADTIGRFTILWSLKEAVSKLVGLGFACGFTQIECRETRLGTCEIQAPEEPHLYGLYVWQDRYVVAIVTDVPARLDNPSHRTPQPSPHPWYEQLSRAKRLRRLRRARALADSPHTASSPPSGTPDPDEA